MSKVSVVMSVYNEEKYIKDSIYSVINQTFSDWELIIIDDGSSDKTVEMIHTFQDDRIRLYCNEKNEGLIHNLNLGLSLATGDYIARMDGDDISEPTRFEKQVSYLDQHEDVVMTGCYVETFGNENHKWRPKNQAQILKATMLLRPVLAHPSIMFRRERIEKHEIRYHSEYKHAEDYKFISDVSQIGNLAVVEEVLFRYRIHAAQVTSKGNTVQAATADRVRKELLKQVGVELSEDEFMIYKKWVHEESKVTKDDFLKVRAIMERIVIANRESQIFELDSMEQILNELYIQWMISTKKLSLFIFCRGICKGIRHYRIMQFREILRRIR